METAMSLTRRKHEEVALRMKRRPHPIKLLLTLGLTLLAVLILGITLQADAAAGPNRQDAPCLSCHSDPGLEHILPDGEVLSLYIDAARMADSVHESIGISCDSCHPNITAYPHPAIDYGTRRELSRELYLTCRTCHAGNYDNSLDSIHAEVAIGGELGAPVCTDCHGAHYTQLPDKPRALISETCGQCHGEILQVYKDSIHGWELIEQDNPDVPVCTDCHGVHNIQDPRTSQFRIDSPELCAGCHADPERMGKYGYTTDVYSLYTISWHGVDVEVYKANWPTIWHESAVCTDCHGVHDILPASDPDSSVNPANLLATCQQCHPDAGPNWTGAWTGHNEVSLERTPFVFYTEVFYSSFVPFILILAAGYVLLRMIRGTVERVRRNLP
jgi:predicted CXXCH cytochrome family protein